MAETSQRQASKQPRKNTLQPFNSIQIMFALILAVGLMLTIQFSTRITQDRNLQQMLDTVQQEIDLLEAEQNTLQDQLAFVEGDAYVEAWARGEGRMVLDGEILVLPIPSQLSNPAPVEAAETASNLPESTSSLVIETTLPEAENWQLWWALFFDSPPPSFN